MLFLTLMGILMLMSSATRDRTSHGAWTFTKWVLPSWECCNTWYRNSENHECHYKKVWNFWKAKYVWNVKNVKNGYYSRTARMSRKSGIFGISEFLEMTELLREWMALRIIKVFKKYFSTVQAKTISQNRFKAIDMIHRKSKNNKRYLFTPTERLW